MITENGTANPGSTSEQTIGRQLYRLCHHQPITLPQLHPILLMAILSIVDANDLVFLMTLIVELPIPYSSASFAFGLVKKYTFPFLGFTRRATQTSHCRAYTCTTQQCALIRVGDFRGRIIWAADWLIGVRISEVPLYWKPVSLLEVSYPFGVDLEQILQLQLKSIAILLQYWWISGDNDSICRMSSIIY